MVGRSFLALAMLAPVIASGCLSQDPASATADGLLAPADPPRDEEPEGAAEAAAPPAGSKALNATFTGEWVVGFGTPGPVVVVSDSSATFGWGGKEAFDVPENATTLEFEASWSSPAARPRFALENPAGERIHVVAPVEAPTTLAIAVSIDAPSAGAWKLRVVPDGPAAGGTWSATVRSLPSSSP